MNQWNDAYDYLLDVHNLLRADAVGQVISAPISVNKLLLSLLAKHLMKQPVELNSMDICLIASALRVAASDVEAISDESLDRFELLIKGLFEDTAKSLRAEHAEE